MGPEAALRQKKRSNVKRPKGRRNNAVVERTGQGLAKNREYDQQRGIFRLMKPFFRGNTLCIARKNGAQQTANSSLFWHDDGFQPDPARAPAAAD